MSAVIDAYREKDGVEPICRTLGVTPSTYYAVKARRNTIPGGQADLRSLQQQTVATTS